MTLEKKIDLLLRELKDLKEKSEDWIPDEDVMHLFNYKKRSLSNLEKKVGSDGHRRLNREKRIWKKSALINLCK